MSVWFCIPSKRPAEEANRVLSLWAAKNYKIALWRDDDRDVPICDLLVIGQYPGYARAVNALAKEVLERDAECDWVVTGGDDVEPDPSHTAEEIARECSGYFMRLSYRQDGFVTTTDGNTLPTGASYPTFGVMQPTGDRWGEQPELGNLHPMRTAYIDRVAGSPWLGRSFCEQMYGGKGPLFEGYWHMHVDQELFEVANKLGVYWQRPDLTHLHNHWMRGGGKPCPDFLRNVSSAQHWEESKQLFESRKAAGFPGHEPLPAMPEGGGIYGAAIRGGLYV